MVTHDQRNEISIVLCPPTTEDLKLSEDHRKVKEKTKIATPFRLKLKRYQEERHNPMKFCFKLLTK